VPGWTRGDRDRQRGLHAAGLQALHRADDAVNSDSMILRVQGSAGTANRRTWRLPWAGACPGCMHGQR